jgi:transglycosylase-like protein
VHRQCTARAAFPVSATFAGGSPLGSSSSSTGINVKRLLPIAAAPAAMAGLAAAFALGNGPSAPAATADIAEHHSATPADPQTHVSAAQPVAITKQTATGLPVVRLDASRLAAIQPKGKHHRTLPTKYVVQSGDTLASIAKHLYHSSDYWTVLYWANHTQIKYANEIHEGQALTVPAKPAKVPSAPKTLAPAPPPTTTTTVSSGGSSSGTSSSSASTTAPVQTVSTSTSASSSFQACVIARESGGNPQVMNASGHYGLYQFSASTWAAYGGNPADFGHASVSEQNQVFNNAIAAGGESNWAPYDGC